MKFYLFIAIPVVMIFFSAGKVMSMPTDADSNTAQMTSPESRFSFAAGASSDFVLGRDLEAGEHIERSNWSGANLYFDPTEKLHLSLFLGVQEAEIKNLRASLSTGGIAGIRARASTGSDFAFKLGGKYDLMNFELLPDRENAKLFASGGYRYTNPTVESAVTDTGIQPSALAAEVRFQEWQAAMGVSQRFDGFLTGVAFIPYLGAKYSDLNLNLEGEITFPVGVGTNASAVTGQRGSEHVIGMFVGLQILAWEERLSFDVEGRFYDETAVYVNAHMRW